MDILKYFIENPIDTFMITMISGIVVFVFYDVLKRTKPKKEEKECKCSNCKCGKS